MLQYDIDFSVKRKLENFRADACRETGFSIKEKDNIQWIELLYQMPLQSSITDV